MTIREIRSSIRAILVREHANTDEGTVYSRYSDGELNRLINVVYRMFLEETFLYSTYADVTVTNGVGSAPDGCIRIHRVEVNDVPLDKAKRNSYGGPLPV